LICATETPNNAGSISFKIRRTPSSLKSAFGSGNNRSRARNGNWNSSCTPPAISTPQASAMIGVSNQGLSQTAEPIRHRFSSTGVKAGMAKRS
jgi:hypothetical protein